MNIEQMQQELTRLQDAKELLDAKAVNRRYSTAQRERFTWEAQQLANRIGQLEYSIRRERELSSPMAQAAKAVADQLKAKEEATAAQAEADRQARIKASAQAAFLHGGGAPEFFETLWPGIKANLAQDAALAAARQALRTEPGSDIRQFALNALREKYRLPKDDQFTKPSFIGKAEDAFASLEATYAPADDVPADSVVVEVA